MNEYLIMCDLYDKAMESLGFPDINHKPSMAKYVLPASAVGATQGFNPKNFIMKNRIKSAMPIVKEARIGYDTEYIAWAITQDLDSYESDIVNSIDKLRASLGVNKFDVSEVNQYAFKITYMVTKPKYVDKNSPVIIHIPVTPSGVNPSKSPIFSQWSKEIHAICGNMKFTHISEKYKWFKIKARYNESTNGIEIFACK